MKALLLYLFLLLSCSYRNIAIEKKYDLNGKVIKIVDGDTFDLLTESNTTIRIRLNAIDCPERKQDYYQVCKDALAGYISGKDVQLITHGKDRYTRTIADVFYNNENINLNMVRYGFAWHYKKYSSNPVMAKAEKDARKSKIGLWQMKDPVAPWEFRRAEKRIVKSKSWIFVCLLWANSKTLSLKVSV